MVCAFGVQEWCWRSTLTVGEWAAWAQAIGSLLAVAAAISVVAWQLAHERRSTKAREVRQIQTLWQLVYELRVEMADSLFVLGQEESQHTATHPGGLEAIIAALRSVSTLDLPEADAAVAVVTAVRAYDDYAEAIAIPDSHQSLSPSLQQRRRRLQRAGEPALKNFSWAERRLHMLLKNRGAALDYSPPSVEGRPYPPLDP
jgi:hypothetical protein